MSERYQYASNFVIKEDTELILEQFAHLMKLFKELKALMELKECSHCSSEGYQATLHCNSDTD